MAVNSDLEMKVGKLSFGPIFEMTAKHSYKRR